MEKFVKTLSEFRDNELNPMGETNHNNALSNKDSIYKSNKEIENGMGSDPDSEEDSDIDTHELNLAEELLEDLVKAVGSEEEVESAAKEAYEDLKSAYDSNEIEMMEEGVPENLAMSALILKLVEQGKLDPKKADEFIGDNADD